MSSEILQKGCSFGFLANTATAVLLQMPYIFAVDQEDLLKASSPYMLKKIFGSQLERKRGDPNDKGHQPKMKCRADAAVAALRKRGYGFNHRTVVPEIYS